MKWPTSKEKWGAMALGAVSLVLVVNLIRQLRTTRAEDSRPHPSAVGASRTRSGRVVASAGDDLARFDPVLHLGALKELDARPLPDLGRNLFDFVLPPAPKVIAAQPTAGQTVAPPPPPPMDLKPEGYNEMPGGVKQAFVGYGAPPNDQTIVVREGDVVMSRYKILKITPTMITVEDDTAHQTAELPIPQ